MREMKGSGIPWVGKIPKDWNMIKLGFLFERIGSGTTPASSDGSYYDGEYHWLQTGELNDGDILTTSKSITEKAIQNYSALTLFSSGSLVIAMYGATVGKLGMLRIPAYMNQACCAFEKPKSCITKFIYYWLLGNRDSIISLSLGGGQPNISQSIIRSLRISLPEQKEQERIVEYLDAKCNTINTLIVAKEKTNALLKERRQSLIYEAVTKGLDLTVPMKYSGIDWLGMIPKTWSTWRMKHLAEMPLQYGANATGTEYEKDLPRYVRITDITDDRQLSQESKQSLPTEIASNYMLSDGDILFARSGATSGKSYYYQAEDGECCFAGYLICFRADKSKVNSKLLYYYTLTQAYEQWTHQIFIQATIQNISAEKYNNLVFAIPATVEEQNQIVEYLDQRCAEIDQMIQKNAGAITKLKEYRQSLIYEAVTGKIDLISGRS